MSFEVTQIVALGYGCRIVAIFISICLSEISFIVSCFLEHGLWFVVLVFL